MNVYVSVSALVRALSFEKLKRLFFRNYSTDGIEIFYRGEKKVVLFTFSSHTEYVKRESIVSV